MRLAAAAGRRKAATLTSHAYRRTTAAFSSQPETCITPTSCAVHHVCSWKSPFSPRYCHRRSMTTSSNEEATGFRQSEVKDSNGVDSGNFNSLISSLCRSGNLSYAAEFLRHMQDSQISIKLKTFNLLLQQASEADDFALFTQIFKHLLLSKVPPSSDSYAYLTKSLEKVSDPEIVCNFIEAIAGITKGKDPTVVNRIIFAMGKSGQIHKSLIVFRHLKRMDFKMDVVTINTVVAILGKSGSWEEMLSELTAMEDRGVTPDGVTYNTVINCLRRLGKFELCRQFAQKMIASGISFDLKTYTALVDAFGRAGHIKYSVKLFNEMKLSVQPSVYIYRALISDLNKAGDVGLAVKMLEEMKAMASELLGPEHIKQKLKRRSTKPST